MSARIDIETVSDAIKEILISYLNDKITSINSEKSDGIECQSINENAYFFQSMNENLANFDPFIFFGLNEVETISDYSFSALKLTFGVTIIMADGGRKEITRMAFRYLRALREVFEEHWSDIGGLKVKIDSLTPVDLQSLNSSLAYKAVGVTLEISLG